MTREIVTIGSKHRVFLLSRATRLHHLLELFAPSKQSSMSSSISLTVGVQITSVVLTLLAIRNSDGYNS